MLIKKVGKHTYKSILHNYGFIALIFLILSGSSFMTFNMQSSIDKNLSFLLEAVQSGEQMSDNQKDYLTALQSNKKLVNNLNIITICIAAFVYILFFQGHFRSIFKELGLLKAIGISTKNITFIYLRFSLLSSGIAIALGGIAGCFMNSFAMKTNAITYEIPYEHLVQGLNMQSILMLTLPKIIVIGVISVYSCKRIQHKEDALLMSGAVYRKTNRMVEKISNGISKYFPKRYSASVRIALRKPFLVLLVLLSIGVFSVFLILAGALIPSSKIMIESQKSGHDYEYNTTFAQYQNTSPRNIKEYALYLKIQSELMIKTDQTYDVTMIAIDQAYGLLNLVNMDKESLNIPQDKTVIISQGIHKMFHYDLGDLIKITINNQQFTVMVSGVAYNGESNGVYIARTALCEMLGLDSTTYSGILSNTIPEEKGITIDKEERNRRFYSMGMSSRSSSVMNEIIGTSIAALLICLSMLVTLRNNRNDMFTLRIQGQSIKDISRMLMDIYQPIICLSYFIMYIPSIQIAKSLQAMLSIQTNDYMSFYTDIGVFILGFVISNLIFYVVKAAMLMSIKRTIRGEKVAAYFICCAA